jgi:hypothetical protein
MADQPDLPLARVEPAPLARADNPMAILAMAVERGLDPAGIKELAELAWKQEDRKAAQEFNDALMQFQDDCPTIPKSATANIASHSGSGYSYKWAPLETIDAIVRPVLRRLGFSYSWDTAVDGGMLTATCTLRHVNGHKESSSFACPTESNNPGMSKQQKHAGTDTFARRYSLTAVLGLTTTDEDTDGADPTPITEKQVADIDCLIADIGGLDHAGEVLKRTLAFMKVDRLEDIRASEYGRAIAALERKRGQG